MGRDVFVTGGVVSSIGTGVTTACLRLLLRHRRLRLTLIKPDPYLTVEAGATNQSHDVPVTLVPYGGPWGEVKTKTTQHSVIQLREIGIQPDMLVCRSKLPLTREMKEKIALFCDVDTEGVIDAVDTDCVYEVPLTFER